MKLNNCYNLAPITVRPEQLYLDPRNPRIALEFEGVWSEEDILNPKVQERLLEALRGSYHVEKLMQNISEKGFQKGMGSFLVKKISTDKFIVLEGNRRTAAIKLLLRDPESQASLDQISVSRFDYVRNSEYTEEEVISCYLARIHIDGPEEWGAMEKAKFVFDDYMRDFMKNYPSFAPWEETFFYDPNCGKRAASISNISTKALIAELKIFRTYRQLRGGDQTVQPDIYSLLSLAVGGKDKVRDYFEVTKQFLFSDAAIERFGRLCLGNGRPINNPKVFLKFAKILRDGTAVEIGGAEGGQIEEMFERMLARLQKRGPKPQLERIIKIFEQITVNDVAQEQLNKPLTKLEKELLNQILASAQNMLNILT